MFFLTRFKKSRNPLDMRPLRVPAQSLEAEFYFRFMKTVALWIFMAIFMLVMACEEWLRFLWPIRPHPIMSTIAAGVAVVVALLRINAHMPALLSLYQGVLGERVVGQMLEDLRPKGYRVFHDLLGDGFNIDHVMVGPAGVFVIETKARRKPRGRKPNITYDGNQILVDGYTPDRDPIVQTKAAVSYVRRLIETDTGKRPPIRGVVLYPGWFIERQPKGVEVWVLNPKNLPSFLDHEDSRLSEEESAAIVRTLEKLNRSQV